MIPEHINDFLEFWDDSDTFWRASFDLSNAPGLSLITIDKAGNINGERINY